MLKQLDTPCDSCDRIGCYGGETVARTWRYEKVVRPGQEQEEREWLARLGVEPEVRYVRNRAARFSPEAPLRLVELRVTTSQPSQELVGHHYRPYMRMEPRHRGVEPEAKATARHQGRTIKAQQSDESGLPVGDRTSGGGLNQYGPVEFGTLPPSRNPQLQSELELNEEFCRRRLGMKAKQRERLPGSGIPAGKRRGIAVDVYGTCSYCLSKFQKRWRFQTVDGAKQPVFLCEGCIERARAKRPAGGEGSDAMHRAVYRKKTRG